MAYEDCAQKASESLKRAARKMRLAELTHPLYLAPQRIEATKDFDHAVETLQVFTLPDGSMKIDLRVLMYNVDKEISVQKEEEQTGIVVASES